MGKEMKILATWKKNDLNLLKMMKKRGSSRNCLKIRTRKMKIQ
jgi:hypothetical protein